MDRDPSLTETDKDNILKKTLIRVQRQIKFRNPKLRIPSPDMEKVRRSIELSFDSMVDKVSVLVGVPKEDIKAKLGFLGKHEEGLKLLWALSRRLQKKNQLQTSELLAKMDPEMAVRYLLLLSWEIECGNQDLVFIDEYEAGNTADMEDLRKAANFCFDEIRVNARRSITAKKVLLSVQTNSFNIKDILRVLSETKSSSHSEVLDKDGQLSKRNIIVPEIDKLKVHAGVFNPVFHYQMTGVLANVIPEMPGAKVLDVGSGTGILGVLSALRGAEEVVMVEVNEQACSSSIENSQRYGVVDRTDVSLVPKEKRGKFFGAIDRQKRFDLIITNPPWGAGSMTGDLGKNFSDPEQRFLEYFLTNAPDFLKEDGQIIIGYSSRNDYEERTLTDVLDSLKGQVDYDWEVLASLEFTRALYSEMFYAVRLRVKRTTAQDEHINNRRASVVRAYNEVVPEDPLKVRDDIETIVFSVMNLIEDRGKESAIKQEISTMKENVGRLYVDAIISSALVKARAAKRSDQDLIIGLDTSWIPGMQERQLQGQALRPLVLEVMRLDETLRGLGLSNVKVVRAEEGLLAKEVLSAMRSTERSGALSPTTFDNVDHPRG